MNGFKKFAVIIAATFLCNTAVLSSEGPMPVVGTWKADVSIDVPAGIPNFFDLLSFHADGTLTESHQLYSPYHPLGAVLYAPGLGEWKFIPPDTYLASFILPFEGSPDNPGNAGVFLGTNTVDYRVIVDSSGQMTGNWKSTAADPVGNVLLIATGKLTASRVVIRSP